MRLAKIQYVILVVIGFAFVQSLFGQSNEESQEDEPTTEEVSFGLKEVLIKGITIGAKRASIVDGYYKNPKIKIPFPPEVKHVEKKLRAIGLGKEVDKFVLALNRGAEDAAKSAVPIFIAAIKELTMDDVWSILKGGDNAATEYLRKATSAQLREQFSPIIQESLNKVHATN